ncbi:carboxypeptidase-like regulatory domain-containing protein [Ectobacillus funiculus]|uniref:carboxypeptidase-like regulatory domain-containing protein n=1 Tax=Ectobacillus funiculus TaxID=137993 RepID=UPI00101BB00C|nr:carboxypeptidase-like regulatory domain-containing protein [Ectobacillus funiculus]
MRRLRGFVLLVIVMILFGSSIGTTAAQFDPAKSNKANLQTEKESFQKEMVAGAIKEGDIPLKNAILLIQAKNKDSNVYEVVTNSSGKFKAELSDGSYTIKAFKQNQDDPWYVTNQSFLVENETVKGQRENQINIANKTKLKEHLKTSEINVQGVLQEGKKGIKGELLLVKSSENGNELFAITSKNNGTFSASLPDGTYNLWSITIEGGVYPYNLAFSVEGNDVYINGEKQSSITISLPENQYTGMVHDSAAPVADALVLLEKMVGNDEYEFVQSVVSNKKGEIQLRELPDGKYSLRVSYNDFDPSRIIEFEIVSGKVLIAGKSVSIFDIKVPDITLTGILMDDGKPVGNGGLLIKEYSNEGYPIQEFYVAIDKKGKFEYRLKDGSYKVVSIDEPGRSTVTDTPFLIHNGRLVQDGEEKDSLFMSLPAITFSGKLIENGNVLQGMVKVESVIQGEEASSYYAQTNDQGIYSLRLPDGQYRVSYVYLSSEGFSISLAFEMREGKLYVDGEQKNLFELLVTPVTLHGIVLDGETPVTGGDIIISFENGEGHFGGWIRPDGTFHTRLQDGNYVVNGIYLEDGTYVSINKGFTISGGKLYVDGSLIERLEISLP